MWSVACQKITDLLERLSGVIGAWGYTEIGSTLLEIRVINGPL